MSYMKSSQQVMSLAAKQTSQRIEYLALATKIKSRGCWQSSWGLSATITVRVRPRGDL